MASFEEPRKISQDSSVTHVANEVTSGLPQPHPADHPLNGHGEPVAPVDGKEEVIANLIDDWEDDPANARNWSKGKKWLMVVIISYYTFIPPLSSSMVAPGLPNIAEMYNITSETETALVLSVFLLSFAVGPLIMAPLSEMYGRVWVLHIGNLLTTAFNLGAAFAPNSAALIVLRFMTGFSGSASLACGGGTVGDLFAEKERASAMSFYILGPLIGPAIGPVAGGFVTQTIGVKWLFIIIAAVGGLGSLVGIPFLRETYAPVLRSRKAKKGGDVEFAKYFHPAVAQMSKGQYLWVNLSRPVMLLTRSFICFILSLYMSLQYGIYYLMFATFPAFFSDTYGFGPGIGGLMYIGLGLGFIVATWFSGLISDKIYFKLCERNGGIGKPEMRIPTLIVGSWIVPIGLFWYGWSAEAKLHWIMPVVGTAIFGFGLMTTFMPIILYLVDAFTYAASALSAAFVFRSLWGFAFPLFSAQMFSALGIGPGNSLLAGLTIVIGVPFPIWIYFYGEKLRERSNLTR